MCTSWSSCSQTRDMSQYDFEQTGQEYLHAQIIGTEHNATKVYVARIIQKCIAFGGSDKQVAIFFKTPSNIKQTGKGVLLWDL